MTSWPLRVTIAVPASRKDDANDLAMVLGRGPADARTFTSDVWEDAAGNRYCLASTQARATFPSIASSTLDRPEWDDTPYKVNMAGANRAQDALVVYTPQTPYQASPDKIVAVVDVPVAIAIDLLGISQVQAQD